jgi:hypothetical protein
MQDETEREKELAARKAAEEKWKIERKDQLRQAFSEKREENVKRLENSRTAARTGYNHRLPGEEIGPPQDGKKFKNDLVREVLNKEAIGEAADRKRFVEAEIEAGEPAAEQQQLKKERTAEQAREVDQNLKVQEAERQAKLQQEFQKLPQQRDYNYLRTTHAQVHFAEQSNTKGQRQPGQPEPDQLKQDKRKLMTLDDEGVRKEMQHQREEIWQQQQKRDREDWSVYGGQQKELKQTQALQTPADLMQEVEERQRLNALQQGKGKGLGQG